MIDCDEKAPKDNIRNAIILKKWEGDPNDRTLFDLIPFLQSKYSVVFIQFPRYKLFYCPTKLVQRVNN